MFMFLLLAAYPTSLLGLSDHDSERSPGLSRVGERSRAPSDHGVKRVREAAVRTAVEAIDASEVSGLLEVALDEAHVAGVVEAVPDLDRLRGKAAVGERNRHRRAALQHAPDLTQHLHGPGQVVYRDTDSRPVELPTAERQAGVRVQILNDVGVEPLVAAQLHLVHAEADHTPVVDFWREVAHPTAHEVEDLTV